MLAAVRRACQRDSLLAPGPLVVAVSGGADSVCLLDLLRVLAPEQGLTLHVAHFQHGLRGVDAEADARFVAELADRWGLACSFGGGDVATRAYTERRSLEAVAHDLRWTFLHDIRLRVGAPAVATGHTQDDQAETVLMHLLRGSGLAGLAGLPPKRHAVVRPLLDLSHAETAEWCRLRGLPWREDASNAEPWCRRNAVRLEVLPFLRRYNPALTAILARSAETLQADLAFLEEETVRALAIATEGGPAGEQRLKLAAYRAAPRAIQRRLLQRWIGAGCTAAHVLAAEALLAEGQAGDASPLPGGRRLVRQYDDAVILDMPDQAIPSPIELAVPGQTMALDWGWEVRVDVRAGPLPPPRNPWMAHLDAAAVKLPLLLRSRRPGDRIQLDGLASPKKLQDLLVDAKIPRRQRDRVGVVEAANGVAWIAGLRVAAWAAASETSAEVLRLVLRQLGDVGC